jgi:hypothetical protein
VHQVGYLPGISVSVFKSTDFSEIDSVSLIRVLIRLDSPYQARGCARPRVGWVFTVQYKVKISTPQFLTDFKIITQIDIDIDIDIFVNCNWVDTLWQ